ncbi:hypothetical protein PoB_004294200 [Plakobranchus ocellatus]|uniref:Cilia- and flagella-associated protein 299 n=1 Tax=Plakobranchus ocellatus TaxID=259542 RepID=A0AAV4BBA9_9GAST|nr:hypothetical protein PoB_004294200 [Plakobranchus ocellatus]
MNRFGNVYDFNDFVSCVRKAKYIPILMKPQYFRAWQSGVSHNTPNRLPERPELVSMVQGGRENLLFKIALAGVERQPQVKPGSRSQPRAVHPKKNDIVNKLLSLIPTTR